MIKKLLIVLIVFSVFSACNPQAAFNYSQNIVKKEQSLTPDITSTEQKVKVFNEKEQFDSIAVAGRRMEKLVDDRLNEIKEQPAPDVKEGPAFKDASIKYFEFIKSIYTGYKNYGNAAAETRQQEMSKLQQMVLKKADAIADMQHAQRKFASANGFRIENN
jgi:hypothetical protein